MIVISMTIWTMISQWYEVAFPRIARAVWSNGDVRAGILDSRPLNPSQFRDGAS